MLQLLFGMIRCWPTTIIIHGLRGTKSVLIHQQGFCKHHGFSTLPDRRRFSPLPSWKPPMVALEKSYAINNCSMRSSVHPSVAEHQRTTGVPARNYSQKITEPDAEYDLIVIGGGVGGLACAKEAARYGATVCVVNYVAPSPQGTVWGIGGTRVNVGCLPTKLFHEAALQRRAIKHAYSYGWQVPRADTVKVDWSRLVKKVQKRVQAIALAERAALEDRRVTYVAAKGTFVSPNLVKADLGGLNGTMYLWAEDIVIATGSRPEYLGVEGDKECCVTSDDIFSLKEPPGKTLIIGGGYVGLETAGFLKAFDMDTTVLVKRDFLPDMDQEMAKLVVDDLKAHGVRFLHNCEVQRFKKRSDGMIEAAWIDKRGKSHKEKFKTVMMAVGRRPATENLHLEGAGVKYNKETGKIPTGDEGETTNVVNIHAVGDVLEGRPELTPVAAKAGRFLARRLFTGTYKAEGPFMDYMNVPMTIFTPLEYACCGVSEELAKAEYGEENIEVFHGFYKPLSHLVPKEDSSRCYMKIICCREVPQEVIGLHYTGPNAGEIMQGFACALQSGLTREDMESTLGIHPTNAEEFVNILVTKRSGEDPTKSCSL